MLMGRFAIISQWQARDEIGSFSCRGSGSSAVICAISRSEALPSIVATWLLRNWSNCMGGFLLRLLSLGTVAPLYTGGNDVNQREEMVAQKWEAAEKHGKQRVAKKIAWGSFF